MRKAGFQDLSWSYGSREPEFYEGPIKQEILQSINEEYGNFDKNSTRFIFQSWLGTESKVAIIPSSYAHISIKDKTQFQCHDDLFYLDGISLLRSLIQMLVREPIKGSWTSALAMWAITHVYGELMIEDSALDSCDDEEEEAKAWFNDNIKRFDGGIDRVTCTKRLGRVGYDESLARIR